MSVIYVATRIITFFGAYLRTFWEHVACRLCKVGVEDIRAFKSGEMCGHVEHEVVKAASHSFLICWFPFTMNFVFGCLLLLSGAYKLIYIGHTDAIFNYVTLWLGVSLLANCAPSYEDVLTLKDNLYKGDGVVRKIVASPFFAVFYVMSFLEKFGITLLLAIGFSIGFPYLFGYTFRLLHVIFGEAV